MPDRPRPALLVLAGPVAALVLALAACGGAAPPAPTAGDAVEETFPDLPTFNSSPGDPFDTLPPEASQAPDATPGPGAIACLVDPAIVNPGQTYVLFLTEIGDWYGSARWYQISGMPAQPFVDMQDSNGAPGTRILVTGQGVAGAGSNFTINVLMRDWDPHGIRPGQASQTIRPAGTNHEGTCAAALTIPFIP